MYRTEYRHRNTLSLDLLGSIHALRLTSVCRNIRRSWFEFIYGMPVVHTRHGCGYILTRSQFPNSVVSLVASNRWRKAWTSPLIIFKYIISPKCTAAQIAYVTHLFFVDIMLLFEFFEFFLSSFQVSFCSRLLPSGHVVED